MLACVLQAIQAGGWGSCTARPHTGVRHHGVACMAWPAPIRLECQAVPCCCHRSLQYAALQAAPAQNDRHDQNAACSVCAACVRLCLQARWMAWGVGNGAAGGQVCGRPHSARSCRQACVGRPKQRGGGGVRPAARPGAACCARGAGAMPQPWALGRHPGHAAAPQPAHMVSAAPMHCTQLCCNFAILHRIAQTNFNTPAPALALAQAQAQAQAWALAPAGISWPACFVPLC